MIHWEVLDDLYKMAKEKCPDLTDDQQFQVALMAYRDIEYKVLMGPSSPVGIMEGFTYPKAILDKVKK